MTAKATSLLPPTETRLPYTGYIPAASRHIRNTWRKAWEGLDDYNSLRQRKKSGITWPSLFQGNKHWEVVLNRLRLGYKWLSHGHYMSRRSRPMYPRCDTRLTIRHIHRLSQVCRRPYPLLSLSPHNPTHAPTFLHSWGLPTFRCDNVISFLCLCLCSSSFSFNLLSFYNTDQNPFFPPLLIFEKILNIVFA